MRQPAVAHRFYPGHPRELEQTVRELLSGSKTKVEKAIAIISPHAGYMYSGGLAGKTIGSAVIPKTVMIIGPNHHGQGAAVAISTIPWEMPNGTVPIATALAEKLAESSSLIHIDELAHKFEHSLEVQVPFLQFMQPDLQLVPVVVSQISYNDCRKVAEAIAAVLKESKEDVLLLASTDMSHYESRSSASVKDGRALAKVTALDPEGLYSTIVNERISMCGFIPVTITLLAAREMGASSAQMIGYTDSGEMSGDTAQVVGYAGVIIS